jgi:hypothetical protein
MDPPIFSYATYVPELGAAWMFLFNLSTRTFDMWKYDGITLTLWLSQSPWSFTVGPCGFSAPQMGGQPSVLEQMQQ